MTSQQIQKYEAGSNRVGAGRLRRIAEFFEVPVSALIGGSEDKTSEVLTFLDTAGAVRLLQGYARIAQPGVRSALVHLVGQLAEDGKPDSRRRG